MSCFSPLDACGREERGGLYHKPGQIDMVCRKSPRYVRGIPAIGFSPQPPSELDQLREAYRSLNDVTRNLANVAACLRKQDLRMAETFVLTPIPNPDWR